MILSRTFQILTVSLAVVALQAGWPSAVEAQRRGGVVRRPAGRPVVVHRPVVVVGGYYGYPYYRRDVWWAQYGYPWGPHPYGFGYGYRQDYASTVRLQVTPRDAEVFVDGYAAGLVDDFDGVFQRLRLSPGGHEISVYLDGYRTLRQNLYLTPGQNHTIREALERLQPGEGMEPRPTPDELPDDRTPEAAEPSRPYEPRRPPVPRTEPNEPRGRFGTLSIRVQPADAEILVDGERWTSSADQARLAIQLDEGRHTLEIRKEGFSVYREDVLIRNNATLTINVSLNSR